jgi:hypothetical protein
VKTTSSVLPACSFALASIAGTASAQQGQVTLTPTTLFFSVEEGKSATAPVVMHNGSSLVVTVNKIEIDSACCGGSQWEREYLPESEVASRRGR